MMDKYGEMPTPPYIKKELKKQDRYQTKYAKVLGSVAAPTAGLHFTKDLLEKIRKKDVKIAYITLHVSCGTFTPVRSDNIDKHQMEPEYYEISNNSADFINNRTGRLFVVGTTSLKTLESSSKKGKVLPGSDWSNLFIKPGYRFKIDTYGLITNFHLPKSTLLMLVSAFIGRERVLKAYNEGIKKWYRFFSFGDSMLLINPKNL